MIKICAYIDVLDLCVFEIFDHKMQSSWPRCWATVVDMATILCLTRLGSSSC